MCQKKVTDVAFLEINDINLKVQFKKVNYQLLCFMTEYLSLFRLVRS